MPQESETLQSLVGKNLATMTNPILDADTSSRLKRRSIWRRARRFVRKQLPQNKVIGTKNFKGSLWDRLRGLDFLFERCRGCTVLDITSSEGLISYEFARRGARLAHGFERDVDRVNFSRRLFRDVPIESRFDKANLAVSGNVFANTFSGILLARYDIVLFLGAYHHLLNQMPQNDLDGLVGELLNRTESYFAVRTSKYPIFEPLILSHGFELVHSPVFGDAGCGPLRIYERC